MPSRIADRFRLSRAGLVRRVARALAGIGVAASVGGCYDLELRQQLAGDGGLSVGADLRFDREMRDVFAFLEALMNLQPQMQAVPGLLDRGLCGAVERAMELNPGLGASPVPMRGRQFEERGHFVCQVEVGVGKASEAVTLMQTNPAMLFSPFKMRSEGQGRYRVALDLAGMPDPEDMLRIAIVSMIMNPKGRRPEDPLPQMPSPEALADIVQKYKVAAVSSARMLGRERTISLVVTAPRIVEANGEIALDRRSVRFRYTWEELTKLLLEPEARRKVSLYAIVEH